MRIVDEVWPYAQVQALIAGADVLVSLHRAEGFGLTPAEAMALGTPVLATAFSGVLDFLDEDLRRDGPLSPDVRRGPPRASIAARAGPTRTSTPPPRA